MDADGRAHLTGNSRGGTPVRKNARSLLLQRPGEMLRSNRRVQAASETGEGPADARGRSRIWPHD